jgi:hypothetical protein
VKVTDSGAEFNVADGEDGFGDFCTPQELEVDVDRVGFGSFAVG